MRVCACVCMQVGEGVPKVMRVDLDGRVEMGSSKEKGNQVKKEVQAE